MAHQFHGIKIMTIKRLISLKQRKNLKDSSKYKGKKIKDLTEIEKDKLLEILAIKAGII